ncbi:MAG: response regulator [Planctomycetes bacterium]|nr:response regulator [Planctomycetota bacterium]
MENFDRPNSQIVDELSDLRRQEEPGMTDEQSVADERGATDELSAIDKDIVSIDKDIVILIAEDEHSHYLLVKYCLKRAGFANEVVWLPDGQDTLDFLLGNDQGTGRDSSVRYILLLDVRMPKVDGLDILKRMKQDPKLKDIPVIVVTTSREQDLEEKCRQLGCVGHVVKPPNKELVSTLAMVAEQM